MNSDTDRPGARHGCRIVATLATTLAAACALITPGIARSAAVSTPVETRVATGDGDVPVIVTLRSQVDETRYRGRSTALIRSLRHTAAVTQDDVVASLDGPVRRFWLVNALATEVDATELEALKADPDVERIELDQHVTVTAAAAAAGPAAPSWGVGAIKAPDAWSMYGATGAGVRIGSIDTGVDATHPELAGAVVGWRDFVAGQPTPYDDNGHGTHTVGTMVARNVAGQQIGVAPGAQVLVAKAIGADGSATGSSLLAAAQWMTDPDGNPATADYPAVINNSWSAAGWDNEWFRPMVQTWTALGIVPVFGAGNTAGSIGNPASYPESIAVGALQESGAIATNSSSGVVTWTVNGTPTQVTKPDLTAPGTFISSTVGGGYALYSGTSMAAPHVAAAVAILKQVRPDLTVEGVRAALRAGAVDRGAPGHDATFGAGSLDVRAALAALGTPVVGPPAVAPQESSTDTTAAPSTTGPRTTVRVVRVTRRGARLEVRGRVSGPANLRMVLRRVGKSQHSRGAVTASLRTRAGSFVLTTPANTLARGRYVLVITATDASGVKLATTSRAVSVS